MIGALYLAAANLLDDTQAALAAGPTKVPDRRGVTAGQVSWLGQCDQLMVAIGNTWLTTSFPIPASQDAMALCTGTTLGCDLTLALVRCFPTLDATGRPPSTDSLDAAAQILGADQQVLGEAVPCSLGDQVADGLILDYAVSGLNMIGPDGGRISIEVLCRIELRRG
jgi:hypothetical protein